MSESTTVVAFDQHAQSVMAAVIGPRDAEPALHALTSDLPTIGRFVRRLGVIRFSGQVDYVGRVSSSFVEESLQAFGGVEISIRRSLVAAAERPGVI